VLYGAQIFISFFLMLIFMTFNVGPLLLILLDCPLMFPQAYLILAVVLGASIGHFVFGAVMDIDAVLAGSDLGKGMACH
jgi:copper transporter 1